MVHWDRLCSQLFSQLFFNYFRNYLGSRMDCIVPYGCLQLGSRVGCVSIFAILVQTHMDKSQ